MTGPGFMGGPANQPSHPDFFALADIVLKMDGDASEGQADIPDTVGAVVDVETLLYVASQRLLRVNARLVQRKMNREQEVAALALYMEAFYMGAMFEQRKAGK